MAIIKTRPITPSVGNGPVQSVAVEDCINGLIYTEVLLLGMLPFQFKYCHDTDDFNIRKLQS